jgi:hypothetical protein
VLVHSQLPVQTCPGRPPSALSPRVFDGGNIYLFIYFLDEFDGGNIIKTSSSIEHHIQQQYLLFNFKLYIS